MNYGHANGPQVTVTQPLQTDLAGGNSKKAGMLFGFLYCEKLNVTETLVFLRDPSLFIV